MKISGIGPTMGPNTIDDDREQELEIAGLVEDTFSPVGELEAGNEPSDEQQTQEGLARLYDFLKAKQDRKAKGPAVYTKADHALEMYQKVKNGDVNPCGQNLKRKI